MPSPLEEVICVTPGICANCRSSGVAIAEAIVSGRAVVSGTSAEALEILGEAKIPAAPVLTPQQALDDPHIRAMGFLHPLDYPGVPVPAPVAKAPVWLSDTPGAIRLRPPTLGEHTDEIMTKLGYDGAAIASLRQRGVI